jgi:hypothetical protein
MIRVPPCRLEAMTTTGAQKSTGPGLGLGQPVVALLHEISPTDGKEYAKLLRPIKRTGTREIRYDGDPGTF